MNSVLRKESVQEIEKTTLVTELRNIYHTAISQLDTNERILAAHHLIYRLEYNFRLGELAEVCTQEASTAHPYLPSASCKQFYQMTKEDMQLALSMVIRLGQDSPMVESRFLAVWKQYNTTHPDDRVKEVSVHPYE